MRTRVSVVFGLIVAVVCAAGLYAQDKEVTLKGKITCAKCDLKVEGQTKCATVIVVKEKDKDVVYYFDAAAHKKHHGPVCMESKDGTVMGKTSKEKAKNIVTVSKLEFSK